MATGLTVLVALLTELPSSVTVEAALTVQVRVLLWPLVMTEGEARKLAMVGLGGVVVPPPPELLDPALRRR